MRKLMNKEMWMLGQQAPTTPVSYPLQWGELCRRDLVSLPASAIALPAESRVAVSC
jgi:hypothetical protein